MLEVISRRTSDSRRTVEVRSNTAEVNSSLGSSSGQTQVDRSLAQQAGVDLLRGQHPWLSSVDRVARTPAIMATSQSSDLEAVRQHQIAQRGAGRAAAMRTRAPISSRVVGVGQVRPRGRQPVRERGEIRLVEVLDLVEVVPTQTEHRRPVNGAVSRVSSPAHPSGPAGPARTAPQRRQRVAVIRTATRPSGRSAS
jgi:hypothetical protein